MMLLGSHPKHCDLICMGSHLGIGTLKALQVILVLQSNLRTRGVASFL
jgi:hypothetical protein